MTELYSSHEIDIKTKIIAKQISSEHNGDATPVVMVGVLNGAFMFYSDLVRNMDIDVECDFIRIKSYSGKERGSINLTKDIETSVQSKHVYLVDDIFDSGETMRFLAKYFNLKGAKTINIVTLVKRAKNEFKPVEPHSYVSSFRHAFECDNEWLIGYGMDSTGGYKRNLKSIFAL
jgi:hypoxanthine phosphoribosyltransferase